MAVAASAATEPPAARRPGRPCPAQPPRLINYGYSCGMRGPSLGEDTSDIYEGHPRSLLDETESHGLDVDDEPEIPCHLGLLGVEREVDRVEAGVGAGQDRRLQGDRVELEEAPLAPGGLEALEAIDRDVGGPCGELKQPRTLVVAELGHHLSTGGAGQELRAKGGDWDEGEG